MATLISFFLHRHIANYIFFFLRMSYTDKLTSYPSENKIALQL